VLQNSFHVSEVSPSYWRVTFDNGPFNLLDPGPLDQEQVRDPRSRLSDRQTQLGEPVAEQQ
jgi:hypothetical protein